MNMQQYKVQATETLLSAHEADNFNQINKIRTLDSLESSIDNSVIIGGMNDLHRT